MLHILLLVLKIIGIIIVSLLSVILLTLCLILFVPMHYTVHAQRTEGDGNPPVEAKAKITWLLHFLQISVCYPSEVYLKCKVFAIPVFRLPRKEKSFKTENKKKNRKATAEEEYHETAYQSQESVMENDEISSGKSEKKEKNYPEKEGAEADGTTQQTSAEQTDTPKISFWKKIQNFLGKIRHLFQNIRYTITGIYDKIKNVCGNIEYYHKVFQSDTFQQAFSLCRSELGKVFRYLKPRKFSAELTIGTNDPATTGQILAYYGILYPLIGHHVTVIGDFENQRLEGTVFIKGKVKVFTLLKAGVRIYFNKDIRKLLKLLKKEEL